MDRNMKGYERSTPGAALGVTAVAMAAITLGAFVVLPAEFDSVSADPNTQEAAKAATKEAVEVATSPARIEVPEVVSREEEVQPGRTTLGAQAFRGKHHKSSSHS